MTPLPASAPAVPRAAVTGMPAILYGTAWKQARTATLVTQAIGAGFRGIDAACQPRHYDEPGVGAAIAASLGSGLSRADLFVQTKYTPPGGQDPQRTPYDRHAGVEAQVAQSVAASLANLRCETLDCLLLHSPLPTAQLTLRAWRALEAAHAAGQARLLGISNCYDVAGLQALWGEAAVKPVVVQNRFHAATGYDRAIRALCRERGMVYQSFWTLTANADLLAHPSVAGSARRRGRTPAQILFRYLTQSGVVPLTGTTSPEHMREDLEIFRFELEAAECTVIAAALDR
ncbi:MAG: aldo/keto reductase family protein [Gammaproteobacteria bacterium]